MSDKNIFGEPLIPCSTAPMTGYFRDGFCNTDATHVGLHTVCIIATKEFLEFSKISGNDLSTPMLQWGFSGLKPDDKWCLCAERFKEAMRYNVTPQIVLEATNEKTLEIVEMEDLIKHAYRKV